MKYNSNSTQFKSPFGAVKTSNSVVFRIQREPGDESLRAVLRLTEESSGETMSIPMSEGPDAFLTARFPGTELHGLIWYNFALYRGEELTGFLCPAPSRLTGVAVFEPEDVRSFQLTVYDADDIHPSWYGQGITYHIFVDRFAKEGNAPSLSGRVIHQSWDELPEYRPNQHGEIVNNDFFGGNLKGIEAKLPYIASLGTETIFLSPVFESSSNHHYDTGDYMKIDPMLGSEEDLSHLCAEASKLGIRIILDGVFNHTGCDSRYFNRFHHYASLGAYESKESPFYSWYSFDSWPEDYSSWWGIYTLPQVNETNPEYQGFIFKNENSVVAHWMRAGISGWRLDVADELPDSFIKELREAARKQSDDAVIIGEVWEDASNKISYDSRRKYILGEGLDGVMNYPFKDALIHYLCNGYGEVFQETIEQLMENYPLEVFYSCMNSLSTHDTPRILTLLGLSSSDIPETKDEKSVLRLNASQYQRAVSLLKLGSLIQFTFPGSPCIFYGDEVGLEGLEDPFNRRTYPWGHENQELLSWYRFLGQLRKNTPALRKGNLVFHWARGDVLCYERTWENHSILVCTNRGPYSQLLQRGWPEGCCYDLLTGRALPRTSQFAQIELPAYSACVLYQ